MRDRLRTRLRRNPSVRPETPADEPLDPFAEAYGDAGDEYDPWEPVNTNIFAFNLKVDRYVLKPVAKGYDFIIPTSFKSVSATSFTISDSLPAF